ncbi:hypothetical protein [Paracoccus sp. NSM]|uniref:hypothetical protein n=1 Tax=Paracoccus sp. NSM TaxID=3457784 RepID=UPI00403670AA
MTPPDHIVGPLNASMRQAVADRLDWVAKALAAGMTRRQIGAALGLADSTVVTLAVKAGFGGIRDNSAANAARMAKQRAARHAPRNGWTWEALHEAGYSSARAAQLRGQSRSSALSWAKDTGKKWTDGRKTEETRAKKRALYAGQAEAIQRGFRAMLADPSRWHMARMTERQKKDYLAFIHAGYRSAEAAAMAGAPHASIEAVRADRAARKAEKAARKEAARRRAHLKTLMAADPETAMIVAMRLDGVRA